MRDFLLHATQFDQRSISLEFGARLAARLGASVTAACVLPDAFISAPRFGSSELVSTLLHNETRLKAGARDAGSAFVEWAKTIGIANATWHTTSHYPPAALSNIGMWHDVLVLGRDAQMEWGGPSDLANLILTSGLASIIVPPNHDGGASLDRIAIAWNGSAEAVRAVQASVPLLQQANSVTVLVGSNRNPDHGIQWQPAFELDAFLRRHGVDSKSRVLECDDAEAGPVLMDNCADLQADLLVMGMFGRSRFSEWVLGGATRHVLGEASLPVFMRH